MPPLSPELQASQKNAAELIVRREKVASTLVVLGHEQMSLGCQLVDAENMLAVADKEIRNGGALPGPISRRATARDNIKKLEAAIEAVDAKCLATSKVALQIDEQLSSAIATYLPMFGELRDQEMGALQDELEAVVRTVVLPYLLKAHATAAVFGGYLGHLERLSIPNLRNATTMARGDLDVTIPGSERIELRQVWRDNPELVAMSDALDNHCRTARRLEKERDRIAREERERIAADPKLLAEALDRQRAESDRRNDEARRALHERETQRAEAERQKPFNTTTYHQPQNSIVGQNSFAEVRRPANMADVVAVAGDRAERIANGL